jgi:S-DNA-T family DNA segregation ATPase FtsK/SpoIIIE
VSDEEVLAVVEYLKAQNGETEYSEEMTTEITATPGGGTVAGGASDSELDEYFVPAGQFIIEKNKASIGMLQRMFKIGFNRAARIMDQLHTAGVVGPEEGTKPRQVLMTPEEFEEYIDNL